MEIDLAQALRTAGSRIAGWAEAVIAGLPNLVAALLILLLFWMAAKLVQRLLRSALERVSAYRAVNRLLSRIAAFGILAVGLFVALGVLNLDKALTSLLAGAGILGLAIGFAAQDSVENLISGILLSIRRPLREGEIVETNGVLGTVQEVNLRATILRSPQGQLVFMPNSEVFQNPLVNYSRLGRRRVDLACGVAYGDDLEEASRVAVAAVSEVGSRDASRDVELFYEEFGGSSVNFVVRFWIDFSKQTDFLSARSEAIRRLKRAFDENGITIPFPIRTLDFGVVGGKSLSAELAERESAGV